MTQRRMPEASLGTPTPEPATRRRGPIDRLADRALSRMLGLPTASTDFTVTRDVRVPTRDGFYLLADHYAPTTAPSLGTLLVRGPYGRSAPYSTLFARVYAERGYHVVMQSSRGTFGSGDVFQPIVRETEDGADTVAWLRQQRWFGGRFATVGLSYLGFTQWTLLTDPPPELAAAAILVGPHDFSRAIHGGGAFALDTILGWGDLLVHQEDQGPLRGFVRTGRAPARNAAALAQVPLASGSQTVLGDRAPWYREWVAHPDVDDPFWDRYRVEEALDRVQVPVLLLGGWQDVFLDQTLEQYARLRDRGVDVALTVGPWSHTDVLVRGAGVATRETLDWLAEHLAQERPRTRTAPVRVLVTGSGTWSDLHEWPPPTVTGALYLHGGGVLADSPPDRGAPCTEFTYDPSDPTPTVGGPLLSPAAGSRDNSKVESRQDVLTFTGPVLEHDLEAFGTVVVELAHSTDNPHADIFVRLCEVGMNGVSRNITQALLRLKPGDVRSSGGPLRLEMAPMAHRFKAGSRIRLQVSGGSHPQYDRNLGTGEPPWTSTEMRKSRHTVAHGTGGQSRVLLPVGPDRAARAPTSPYSPARLRLLQAARRRPKADPAKQGS